MLSVYCLVNKYAIQNTTESDNSANTGTTDTNLFSKSVKQPEVVKFAFKEFTVDGKENKRRAKCTTCNDSITETHGTTTGFARYKFAICS